MPQLLFHRPPIPILLKHLENTTGCVPCGLNRKLILHAVEVYGEGLLKDVDTFSREKANAAEYLKMTRSYTKTYAYIANECLLKNQEFMQSVILREFDLDSAKALTECVDKAVDLLPPQPHELNNPVDKRVALHECVRKAKLMHSGEDFINSVDECYNKHYYDEKKNS